MIRRHALGWETGGGIHCFSTAGQIVGYKSCSANVWSRGLLAGSESGIHNKGVVLASLWHQLAMIWFFSILKNNPLSCPFGQFMDYFVSYLEVFFC